MLFFFQAEDGIRDYKVTGVQTCALPIYRLTGAERKHLVAHSVTGMLIMRGAGAYSQDVEMAVLEHHERMDGTGYPRGVHGEAISKMGRILLLAEVVSA